MTTNHTNCTHEATKADRAKCRRYGAQAEALGLSTRPFQPRIAEAAVEAPAVEPTPKGFSFEMETCMRCAGSGQYPSPAWQGVCLGCNGKGQKLTRRGRAARDRWLKVIEAQPDVNVRDLKVGDRPWVTNKFVKVTADTQPTDNGVTITDENGTRYEPYFLVSFRNAQAYVFESTTYKLHPGFDVFVAALKGRVGVVWSY